MNPLHIRILIYNLALAGLRPRLAPAALGLVELCKNSNSNDNIPCGPNSVTDAGHRSTFYMYMYVDITQANSPHRQTISPLPQKILSLPQTIPPVAKILSETLEKPSWTCLVRMERRGIAHFSSWMYTNLPLKSVFKIIWILFAFARYNSIWSYSLTNTNSPLKQKVDKPEPPSYQSPRLIACQGPLPDWSSS